MWPRRRQPSSKEGSGPELAPHSSKDALRSLGNPALFGAMSSPETDAKSTEVRVFDQLRTDTHANMRLEYARRIEINPVPTREELSLGMYVENLEPQVRAAALLMRAKGYPTTASGFSHGHSTWRIIGVEGEHVPWGTYGPTSDPVNKRAQIMSFQGIDLDRPTIDRLAEVGAEVVYHPADQRIHLIGFVPEAPDLDAITATWDTIANILPDTGSRVPDAEVFSTGFYDWGSTAP